MSAETQKNPFDQPAHEAVFVAEIINDAPQEAEDDEPEETIQNVRFSEDQVGDYLNRMGKAKLLTAEQEVELSMSIEAGVFAEQLLAGEIVNYDLFNPSDPKQVAELEYIVGAGIDARRAMTEANLRLVISIATRYRGHGLDFNELIQEGNLGLMHAISKFDYKMGYKFSTYATGWIRRNISRAIEDIGSGIRVPVHLHQYINQKRRLEQENESITDEELCSGMGISAQKLSRIREAESRLKSLYSTDS